MRLLRRTLLCFALVLGGSGSVARASEPPKEPIPDELRAAEKLRAEVAKAPVLQDLPSISKWNEPWTREVRRLWLGGANGEDVVVLYRVDSPFFDLRTLVGDLVVWRNGAVVSARRGITVCSAPIHLVEPPPGRFIALLRPVGERPSQRIGAFVYEIPSLREVASIVPEKPDHHTSLVGLHDYVAISQDGRALAVSTGHVDLGVTADGDGSIEIHTGSPLKRVRTVPPLSKHVRAIRMRFSRDGRRLAVVYRNLVIDRGHDRRHYLQVFDAPMWQGSNVVAVEDDFIGRSAPVWAGDGRSLYYYRGRLVFNEGKLGAAEELPGPDGDMVVCLMTKTPGRFLAVGQYGDRLNDGARVVARFRPHKDSSIIALSSDGHRLAAWTKEDGLGVWDMESILKAK